MAPAPRPLVAIVGATASGKSEVALALAERHGAEILSCDSMQVYRGFDLGTAKPSREEQARVRHHLVDHVEPEEPYSAARYADEAERLLRAADRPLFLVGGTGLYLRALRFGLVAAPGRDEALRARLLAEEQATPGTLHARLARVDAAAARRIAPADQVRLVRALEVYELTGVPLSEHHAAQAHKERHLMAPFLLELPPALLEARIAARVQAMLARGLVDETRALQARHPAAAALGAVGYREVCRYLAGELPEAELAPAIVRATRQYARRQRTWFAKEPGAARFTDAALLSRAIDAQCRQ